MKVKLKIRKKTGKKVKYLRKAGVLPCSIYGPKRESINVEVDLEEFRKLFKACGYSKLIDTEVEGEGKISKSLIREVQIDPVTDEFIHASFYELDLSKPITAYVPIVTTGVSKAVKDNVGFLVTPVDKIEVRCLPERLPEEIEVDISNLNEIGDNVSLNDIKLPEGVEFTAMKDEIEKVILAYIAPPQKEIVEEEKEEVSEEGEAKEETEEAGESEEKKESSGEVEEKQGE